LRRPDIIVIGGGLAGSSAAAFLSEFASVLVLEGGKETGNEGAAQNSGLIRRMDPEPCDRALAQRTHEFLVHTAPNMGADNLSSTCGAVLGLVRDPLWLHNARAHLLEQGVRIQATQTNDFPILHGAPIAHAWHLPEERITDGPQLVDFLLNHAVSNGALVRCNTRVKRLLIESGRCIGVETENETIHAGNILVAAGAWSGTLAQQAGLHRPLTALRRMAAIIKGPQTIDQPWFWLDDVGLYAKPHNGKWLVSPCDEAPELAPENGRSTGHPSPRQIALLEVKIARYLPKLAAYPTQHTWTGLRTFAPDRRPLLGPDGECDGLWWAAGMGGSGLSSSIGVGQALQAWMQNRETPWLDASGVRPNRAHLRRWPILPDGDPQRARLINAG